MRFFVLLVVQWLFLGACVSADTSFAARAGSGALQVLTSQAHENQNLPFSEAVIAGGLIFVSGQIAAKPGSLALVPGGIEPQTRQVMDNIKDVLTRHGASMDDVAKCTVFIQDMAQWPAMNAVYVSYFPHHKPARSAVGANGIALGGLVEIECIAAAGE